MCTVHQLPDGKIYQQDGANLINHLILLFTNYIFFFHLFYHLNLLLVSLFYLLIFPYYLCWHYVLLHWTLSLNEHRLGQIEAGMTEHYSSAQGPG